MLPVNDIIMAEGVEFIGCYTRLNMRANHFKNFCSQFAGYAHFFNIIRGFNRYCHEKIPDKVKFIIIPILGGLGIKIKKYTYEYIDTGFDKRSASRDAPGM